MTGLPPRPDGPAFSRRWIGGDALVSLLAARKENPRCLRRGFVVKALAVTYVRMGRPHTIIGETPFHF